MIKVQKKVVRVKSQGKKSENFKPLYLVLTSRNLVSSFTIPLLGFLINCSFQ